MEYENYTDTSKKYDEFRVPIGLESLDNALNLASESLGTPVKELKLLDVGCGTGSYLTVMKEKVGKCDGLEFNAGMLEIAAAKHKDDARVTLKEGSVLELANHFPDETFDVVVMTQVMHHLTPDTHQAAISAIGKVLKPGGYFWIQTSTPH